MFYILDDSYYITMKLLNMCLDKNVMRTAEGPFPMETTYTWDEVNGGQ
jgi:hypothetical protein